MSDGTDRITVREYTTGLVYLVVDGYPAHKAKTAKTSPPRPKASFQ
jgi:hypothetical protein